MNRWLRWLMLLGIAALFAAAALSWWLPRRVVRSELHPLYLQYEHSCDVAAGFVKDLRLNDSVTIDVVTLQAKDTATWYEMLGEIGVSDAMIESVKEDNNSNLSSFVFFNIPKTCVNGNEPIKNDIAICTPDDLTVSIYDVRDTAQRKILVRIQFDKITQTF